MTADGRMIPPQLEWRRGSHTNRLAVNEKVHTRNRGLSLFYLCDEANRRGVTEHGAEGW